MLTRDVQQYGPNALRVSPKARAALAALPPAPPTPATIATSATTPRPSQPVSLNFCHARGRTPMARQRPLWAGARHGLGRQRHSCW